jgi:DNA ligase-1
MQRRFLVVALAGCFSGIGVAGSLPAQPVVDEARSIPPAIPLADVYRSDLDPAPYLISEKYDGVRAVWDGSQLRFRSGRRIEAPAWFVAGLPKIALDGELWLGRGRFDELSAIVRKRNPVDDEWRSVRYLVFELSGARGSFAERNERLASIAQTSGVPWLQAVSQHRVTDRKELLARLDDVVRGGGEGLVLHRATAPYATGRSADLLKLKPWLDAEAMVVGHEPGRGKAAGTTGALRLRSPDGKEFRVGSGLDDALRRNPPAVGTTVTYRYQELTRDGVPRFPRFWRIAADL